MEKIEQVNIAVDDSVVADDHNISEGTKPQDNSSDTSDNQVVETSLGKFKNNEALLNAYNSLEAEFTKRSQRLKELEQSTSDKVETPDEKLAYDSEDWQAKVQEFVMKNPIAKEFAEEIADRIINDDALARDKHCLDIALNSVLAAKYRQPEQLLQDDEFLDKYVFSNQSIKDKIVEEYINSLNSYQPPDVIRHKGQISLAPPERPRTLKEAGDLATKLFNRR